MELLLKNAVIVTPSGMVPGDVAVADGKIAAIGTALHPVAGCREMDLHGAYLLPGTIDAHTHFDMPAGDIKTSDDFYTGTRAAIAGGTTTVVDFAEPDTGAPLQQGLDVWHGKADGRSFCDYGFHMTVAGWDETFPSQMESMVAQGVTSFKLYTAYDGMRVSDDVLYYALKEAKRLGAMICVHCENGDLVDALIAEKRRENAANVANHPLTRPAITEKEAVSRVIDIARLAEAPVYIVHLSAAQSLSAVLAQRKQGAQVFVETCPQYLLLDDTYYSKPGFEGAKYVISPPLRTKQDQAVLWKALHDGAIQTVSTDHCSFDFEGQKKRGIEDFTKIPGGMASVEHRLSLLYTYGVKTGRLTLPQLTELTAANPAKIFGMFPQKGIIAPGSDADLVVLEDLAHPEIITAGKQHQRVDYTAYEGFCSGCRVKAVFLRGEQVALDGKITETATGQFLKRTTTQR